MNRRDLLAAVAVLGLAPAGATSAASRLRRAARDAWLWGLPLIENAGARERALSGGRLANQIVHARDLTTAKTQKVTTPNNDTLYSRAWIDLSNGPVTIELPATGDRYVSVAFMDMYTNNFAVLGTRTTGGKAGTWHICGPGFSTGEPGTLRSRTSWVWMLVRVLVDGPRDLPAARAVQDGIKLTVPAAGRVPPPAARRDAPWQTYFSSVQALMLESPPPGRDTDLFKRIAPLGLKPGGGFDPAVFDEAQVTEITAGVADARAELTDPRRQGPLIEGWLYPKANLGDFGTDYLYRAQTALGGLAALPPQEASYMRAVDAAGSPNFDSAEDWRLTFRGGALPPVKAFWSLTLYEATPDGQYFFVDNPLGRYAIGDRTPGLKHNPDGSLDIWISRKTPGPERAANWLPAPASRPFSLILRAYLPDERMLSGSWRAPTLAPASGTPEADAYFKDRTS